MSTNETTPATRPEIRARLDALAPYPNDETPDHARAVARRLAVEAQRHWTRFQYADYPANTSVMWTLTAEFAALHLLMTLIDNWPQTAERLSQEIRNAWDDGGGIGEWLFEHLQALGIDGAEVDRLEAAWRALPEVPAAATTGETP